MVHRTGYNRNTGTYKKSYSPPSVHKSVASKKKSSLKKRSLQKTTSLEAAIKPWLGTPYAYGKSSRSGTDCSGYVMQIYKSHYGIRLPHKASKIYAMGSRVSDSKLKEGDLVFFGNLWGVNHVGIYLSGNRFTHASSSQGVIITSMDMKYWKSKYKGARSFF